MRILVIDDNMVNLDSARQTLAVHNVTTVQSYDDAIRHLTSNSQACDFPYDVVLTDMMMPMCRHALLPEYYNPGELVPYGFVIALLAAHRGAKYVAMVTDTNHHKGAMSAALNCFDSVPFHRITILDEKPTIFKIDGSTVVFLEIPTELYGKENGAKDWNEVLKHLITW